MKLIGEFSKPVNLPVRIGVARLTRIRATALSEGRKMQEMLAGSRTQSRWGTIAQLHQNGWTESYFVTDTVTSDYDHVYPDLEPKGAVGRLTGDYITVEHDHHFTKCKFGNILLVSNNSVFETGTLLIHP